VNEHVVKACVCVVCGCAIPEVDVGREERADGRETALSRSSPSPSPSPHCMVKQIDTTKIQRRIFFKNKTNQCFRVVE
jgi:hypothetical protein